MTGYSAAAASIPTIAVILAVLGAISLIELWIPLHHRSQWSRAHLAPNLALTFTTFVTNAFFNAVLVWALLRFEARGLGALRLLPLGALAETIIVVIALDLAFYVSHIALHHVPAFWRFHRVHHSDPAVDVTTTIRQHPGEGVIRYAFLAAAALALGASAPAFAAYRALSALHGLFEHANIRLPTRLDSTLSLVFSTPNFHKVHHSRALPETNRNYGNILSLFDRLCRTCVPAERGIDVACGLDGFDRPALQTTAALFAMPFIDVADANLRAADRVHMTDGAQHQDTAA